MSAGLAVFRGGREIRWIRSWIHVMDTDGQLVRYKKERPLGWRPAGKSLGEEEAGSGTRGSNRDLEVMGLAWRHSTIPRESHARPLAGGGRHFPESKSLVQPPHG